MLLLSTASLKGYGLHKIFSFASDSKYDGLDLFLTISNYDLWDKEYIKSLVKEFKVDVLSITVSLRSINEKKVDSIIDIAKYLGVQVVTFSPPHFGDKNISWFSKYLLRVKKSTHISISIVNVEPKMRFFIIPEYRNSTLSEIKRVTGDTSLDLVAIDSSSGTDILKAGKRLGNSIKNVFLADKYGSKIGLMPGSISGGISHLPIESFFMNLKISGYNGFITLKVKPAELGVGNNQKVLQNLEFAKKYYEKHFLNFKG